MPMTDHTYRQFDADIDAIRSAFTTMGGLVERQLLRAIDAVRYGDLRLTTAVLVDERQINQMQVESDLRCNQIIAKRQPIAIDLREMSSMASTISSGLATRPRRLRSRRSSSSMASCRSLSMPSCA